MSVTVEEFLERKGAIGILSTLQDGGKTYSEIESEVAITSDTISKRNDEALEIGLIEMQAAKEGDRTVTVYQLTEFGEAVTERLAIEGIVSNYRSMRTHQRKLEAKTEQMIGWLYENPDQFVHFPEVSKETLIDRESDEDGTVSVSGERDVELPDDVSTSTTTEDGEGRDSDGEGDGRTQKDLAEMFNEDETQESS